LIKILLVDNHEIIRAGIKQVLEKIPEVVVVGEAEPGVDVLQLAKKLSPDIIFMGIQMPEVDGLEAMRKIILHHPHIKIIIMSVWSNETYPLLLLKTGAAGYLTRDCEVKDVIQAVRAVLSGKRYINPAIIHQLALKEINPISNPIFDLLSLRELQIAMMIYTGKSIPEIAEAFSVTTKTIKAYRYAMFKKLNITNDVQLVLLAARSGILKNNKQLTQVSS
jgi:two-component system invasion response regulator UvrY